jgi:hypothetical protein
MSISTASLKTDNGSIIWNGLTSNGFNEIAAAGIMGNLKAESNLDPTICEGGGHSANIKVDGTTGYGLAQWTYVTRQKSLADFAAQKGKNSGDLMVQIDFLVQEIKLYGLVDKLNACRTPSEAAYLFHEDFEKSADTPTMAQRRAIFAEEIFKSKGEGASENTPSYDGNVLNYVFGNTQVQGVVGGQTAAANYSPKVTEVKPHGKDHKDTTFENPAKIYCEPVYPDLINVNNSNSAELNQMVLSQANDSDLTVGDNMTHQIPVSTIAKFGGEDALLGIGLKNQLENQRCQAFDEKILLGSYKVPSSGKPANNTDPYPYDAKIEELELHKPTCKIDKIKTCAQAVNVTRAVMELSTDVERRLVRLENNLATIMRYLGRLAARVPINCIYYGGQCQHSKYGNIRCMKDDRISDGQQVTIDQCMTCTRYEPFLGQVYEILNDEGINLSQVLDDCQMSYSTVEEYCNFIKSNRHQNPLESVSLDYNNIKTRLSTDTDFSTEWGEGIKMNWSTAPVEDQQPHVNKIQDTAGTVSTSLNSYPGSATNNGMVYTASTVYMDKMTKNKKLMDSAVSE